MDEYMSRKIGNAQCRTTFFRHYAVLGLPADLLSNLPNYSSRRDLQKQGKVSHPLQSPRLFCPSNSPFASVLSDSRDIISDSI